MFTEDLDVFFSEAEFAAEATFTLPDGNTFSFPVIFDDAFLNPETGLLSLETTEPIATSKAVDLERLQTAVSAVNGGTAVLPNQSVPLRSLPCTLEAAPGCNFSILQVRPEGTGTASIILSHEP